MIFKFRMRPKGRQFCQPSHKDPLGSANHSDNKCEFPRAVCLETSWITTVPYCSVKYPKIKTWKMEKSKTRFFLPAWTLRRRGLLRELKEFFSEVRPMCFYKLPCWQFFEYQNRTLRRRKSRVCTFMPGNVRSKAKWIIKGSWSWKTIWQQRSAKHVTVTSEARWSVQLLPPAPLALTTHIFATRSFFNSIPMLFSSQRSCVIS